MTSSGQPSIAVSDLVKVYEPSPNWMKILVRSNLKEPVLAVDKISFEVHPGEICVVLGPNGAGKTTTFRILVGLTTATSGSSSVMGFDSETESVAVRRLVGWMPGDERALLMRHSVMENLRFHGQLQGMEKNDLNRAIHETLELVGLERRASSTCFALSAGMKARLQLARALLHRPKVLILDEPTGAVDPVASHELVNLIRDIVEERQIAALISSHRLEEIETLHSRVLMLDNGRLRYDGDLDNVRAKYAGPRFEIEFRDPAKAGDAEVRLKDADIGAISRPESRLLVCEPKDGVRHAEVFAALGPFTDEVVALQEKDTPLHAILANIYSDTEGAQRG